MHNLAHTDRSARLSRLSRRCRRPPRSCTLEEFVSSPRSRYRVTRSFERRGTRVTFLAANAPRIISDECYEKVENSLSCPTEHGNFDHDQPRLTASWIWNICLLTIGVGRAIRGICYVRECVSHLSQLSCVRSKWNSAQAGTQDSSSVSSRFLRDLRNRPRQQLCVCTYLCR